MSGSSPVSLLSNIKLDDPDKFELFKVTISDASRIFDEAHFKIRGRLAGEAVGFLKGVAFKKLFLYQELQENDWVSATTEMLECVRTRSVFLYFEDHRLVAPLDTFKSVVEDFEALKLDYMRYSWFRASKLHARNVLPFYSSETANIVAVRFDSAAIPLLGKISPRSYMFSLVSMVSVRYLKSLLDQENRTIKLYSRAVTALLSRLFPYPGYRKVVHGLNSFLRHTNAGVCIYDPSSPFNLEKMWWEFAAFNGGLKVGISKNELFANYDDDNGADGESLMKRGLYPFTVDANIRPEDISCAFVKKTIELSQGQSFNLFYHSAAGRICKPPIVVINVKSGRVLLKCHGCEAFMETGDFRSLYANKGGTLLAGEATVLDLQIFDEIFELTPVM